jgi:hypothetical protein
MNYACGSAIHRRAGRSEVHSGRVFLFLLLASAGIALAASSGQSVDSGSFGVYVNGKRVATEKFSIQQQSGGSVATGEVRIEDGSGKPTQTSELQLTSTGELKRYEWHELSPSPAQAVVTPNEPFLIEQMSTTPGKKPLEQPFMVPVTTMILDNNFFFQRQILAWRYMAGGCKQANGHTECSLAPAKFGVLIPQELTSGQVTMAFAGKEKVNLHGAERELYRLNLTAEGAEWALWLDDSYKLQRVVKTGDNTEIVRD